MCHQHFITPRCFLNVLKSVTSIHLVLLFRGLFSSKHPQKFPKDREVNPESTASRPPWPASTSGVGSQEVEGGARPICGFIFRVIHGRWLRLPALWGAEVRLYLGGTAASHYPSCITGF